MLPAAIYAANAKGKRLKSKMILELCISHVPSRPSAIFRYIRNKMILEGFEEFLGNPLAMTMILDTEWDAYLLSGWAEILAHRKVRFSKKGQRWEIDDDVTFEIKRTGAIKSLVLKAPGGFILKASVGEDFNHEVIVSETHLMKGNKFIIAKMSIAIDDEGRIR